MTPTFSLVWAGYSSPEGTCLSRIFACCFRFASDLVLTPFEERYVSKSKLKFLMSWTQKFLNSGIVCRKVQLSLSRIWRAFAKATFPVLKLLVFSRAIVSSNSGNPSLALMQNLRWLLSSRVALR